MDTSAQRRSGSAATAARRSTPRESRPRRVHSRRPRTERRLLVRFGLLAFLVGILYSSWGSFPITANPDSWYFPSSVVTMLIFAAIAVYAFVVALGDQGILKGSFLDEGLPATAQAAPRHKTVSPLPKQ